MNNTQPLSKFYVGWDVGGWNCDTNAKSRDAIVILDENKKIVGEAWRGNLRTGINESSNARAIIESLFLLCGEKCPAGAMHMTIAIDTPLGFPEAFLALATDSKGVAAVEGSESNPYLFRSTERWLCEQGLRPLSALKDMIGSQATKGMHFVAKFAAEVARCGVWTDGDMLTAIEAYPSPCRQSALVSDLQSSYVASRRTDGHKTWIGGIDHSDKLDALTCAVIAYCFATRVKELVEPPESVSAREGWIWIPRDAITNVGFKLVKG